ncbi:MAG: ArsR/SmtB family transcription factor [Candidatus Dormibacteria bacterium]
MLATSRSGIEVAVLARFFRVLGDPTRVRIISLLEQGGRTVGDLVAEVGEPQPRVSTHLACLRHCGFVETERRGREVIYTLTLGGLDALLRDADDVVGPLSKRLASCTRIGPAWV